MQTSRENPAGKQLREQNSQSEIIPHEQRKHRIEEENNKIE